MSNSNGLSKCKSKCNGKSKSNGKWKSNCVSVNNSTDNSKKECNVTNLSTMPAFAANLFLAPNSKLIPGLSFFLSVVLICARFKACSCCSKFQLFSAQIFVLSLFLSSWLCLSFH